MLEVHAILQRQRCNENITKKTGTLSDAYVARSIWIYKRTTGAGESAVSRSSFFMFISFRDSIITAFIALPAFLNNR